MKKTDITDASLEKIEKKAEELDTYVWEIIDELVEYIDEL